MKEHPLLKLSAALSLVIATSVSFSMLSACGRKSAVEAEQERLKRAGADPGLIPTTGLIHAQRVAREALVDCAPGAPCPEGVGMVVATHEGGVEQCTGFLVAPDLMMTSGRCIPSDLASGQGNCSDRVGIVFPGAESSDCSEVIMREGDSFAFVKLREPGARKPLAIDDSGLPEGMEAVVPVVARNGAEGRPFGEIHLLSCRVVQKSAVLPSFKEDGNPLGTLGRCAVGALGDGGPVLDAKGTVRAIVRGGFQGARELRKSLGDLLKKGEIPDFAFATNLACVPTPLDSASRKFHASCSGRSFLSGNLNGRPGSPDLRRVMAEDAVSAARAELEARLKTWEARPEQKLKWKLKDFDAQAPSQELRPEPVCIAHSERWLADYKHWYLALSGKYEAQTKIELKLPRYQVDFGLNEFAQSKPTVKELSAVPVTLVLSPRSIAETGSSRVTLQQKGAQVTLNLKKCP